MNFKRTDSKSAALFGAALGSALLMATAAQAESPVSVDAIGYDVASDVFVIQGDHFITAGSTLPPLVEIGGVPATVISYSQQFVMAERPAHLRSGEHLIVVQQGSADSSAQTTHHLPSSLEDTLPVAPIAVSALR